MTNDDKAKEISFGYGEYAVAMEMAKWKDEQLYLLIDAIDHAYLKTDGTYGDLSYEVSDKVKYLKSSLKQPIE